MQRTCGHLLLEGTHCSVFIEQIDMNVPAFLCCTVFLLQKCFVGVNWMDGEMVTVISTSFFRSIDSFHLLLWILFAFGWIFSRCSIFMQPHHLNSLNSKCKVNFFHPLLHKREKRKNDGVEKHFGKYTVSSNWPLHDFYFYLWSFLHRCVYVCALCWLLRVKNLCLVLSLFI